MIHVHFDEFDSETKRRYLSILVGNLFQQFDSSEDDTNVIERFLLLSSPSIGLRVVFIAC